MEFDGFKKILTKSGIRVKVFENHSNNTPDAIFPDWFTTHKNDEMPEGIFILYPMKHKSRQLERDQEIIDSLRKDYKYFIDLTKWES
jgi:hypothetical protein